MLSCEHIYTLLGYILRSQIAGTFGTCFQPFEELPNCIPKWLHDFTFPPAAYKGPNFFPSLPILVFFITDILVSVKGISLDLHFPKN